MRRLLMRLDRWHLRWALSEMDGRHPDAGYALQRLANIDMQLPREDPVIAGNRVVAGICGALWVALIWLLLDMAGVRPSLIF